METELHGRMFKSVAPNRRPASGDQIVLAVSGGIDSVALMHLMLGYSRERQQSWALHIAHFNHKLRGADSDADADFVEHLATQHDLPSSIDSTSGNVGSEELARKQRYAFLQAVMERVGARWLATAHQADDNTETILHRIIRGTGTRGLRGIPPCRALDSPPGSHVLRPLLDLTRRELVDFLQTRNLSYRTDRSNEESTYTRNRIRNELLPQLRADYNPGIDRALLRLAEQTRWLSAFIEEQTDMASTTVFLACDDDRTVMLDIQSLLEQPMILRAELVRLALRRLGVGEKKLTFEHVVAALGLTEAMPQTSALELPGGARLRRQKDCLIFSLMNRPKRPS